MDININALVVDDSGIMRKLVMRCAKEAIRLQAAQEIPPLDTIAQRIVELCRSDDH